MFKMILLIASTITLNAYAHVTPGNYQGQDQTGAPCSFTVGDMWFEANMQHPLTERIPLTKIQFVNIASDSVTWNLGHPPVVNTTNGTNRFNHDIFQQILPTSVGANSVTLIKDEEESEEGHKPVAIIYVLDNYRNKVESKNLTCTVK